MKQREDWHLAEALEYDSGRADPFAAAIRATPMPIVTTDPSQTDAEAVWCDKHAGTCVTIAVNRRNEGAS